MCDLRQSHVRRDATHAVYRCHLGAERLRHQSLLDQANGLVREATLRRAGVSLEVGAGVDLREEVDGGRSRRRERCGGTRGCGLGGGHEFRHGLASREGDAEGAADGIHKLGPLREELFGFDDGRVDDRPGAACREGDCRTLDRRGDRDDVVLEVDLVLLEVIDGLEPDLACRIREQHATVTPNGRSQLHDVIDHLSGNARLNNSVDDLLAVLVHETSGTNGLEEVKRGRDVVPGEPREELASDHFFR